MTKAALLERPERLFRDFCHAIFFDALPREQGNVINAKTSTAARAGFPMLGRALLNLLSPGGAGSRLSILIYHRVLPQLDPLFPAECNAQDFEEQIKQLEACFTVIPLSDAVRCLRRRKLPPRAACVTFDDGYADNAEIALPILRNHGIPATFFVATSFLDGGRMWNDDVIELVRGAPGKLLDLSSIGLGQFEIETLPQRAQAISSLLAKLKYMPLAPRQAKVDAMCDLVPAVSCRSPMMTSCQVKLLHDAGMEIGGHTANHPILARMENKAAYAEIAEGKERLENIIRAPVRLFAYPNGKPGVDYLPAHVKMVRDLGFEAAVSTARGAAQAGSDIYQLPRFTPWDKHPVRFTLRMAQNMLKAETVQSVE